MVLAIASAVQPENLTCRTLRRQRVQHRQDGRRPDSRAEEHDGPFAGFQNETSAWVTDVQNVARSHVFLQVGSGDAMRLDFDADPIAFGRLEPRERVAAKERRGRRSVRGGAGDPVEAEGDVLGWTGRTQLPPVLA